jgi:hypothetical protein
MNASSQIQSHIATDGQSVSLGVEPHLGLMTRYLLLFDSYGLVFVGRPLWREDESVFWICCWSSPGSLSRLRVPRYSWPYFTVSDLRLLFSSPPTTRRVTVEVFDPASTRVWPYECVLACPFITSEEPNRDHHFQQFMLLHAYLLLREPWVNSVATLLFHYSGLQAVLTEMNVRSDSTVADFRRHVTVFRSCTDTMWEYVLNSCVWGVSQVGGSCKHDKEFSGFMKEE